MFERFAGFLSLPAYPGLVRLGAAAGILLLFAAVLIFCCFAPAAISGPLASAPPFLLPALSFLFLSCLTGAVAWLVGRGFLRFGSPNLLLFGCGALVLGISSLMTGVLSRDPGMLNQAVTIHHLGFLFSGIFQAAGAVLALPASPRQLVFRRKKLALAAAYAGVALLILLVGWLAGLDRLPPFFQSITGPTFWRQGVLMAALLLFVISAAACLFRSIRTSSGFYYWYTLACQGMAAGLLAFLLTGQAGGPLSWLGYTAHSLASVYLLVAALGGLREGRQGVAGGDDAFHELLGGPDELYRELVETVQDAIISLDSRGRIVVWNPAAERIFGYCRQEAVGTKPGTLLRPEGEVLGPGLEELQRTGQGSLLREITEIGVRTRNGRMLRVALSASVRRRQQGWAVTLVLRDISDRLQAERGLRRAKERLSGLLDSIADGFLALDRNWTVIYANKEAARLTRREPQELLGLNLRELWPGAGEAGAWQEFGRVVAQGKPARFEHFFRGLDSWFEIRAYPFGEGVSIFMQDISARQERERRLRHLAFDLARSNDELKQFAYVASHDLQEPLRMVVSYLDLLQRRYQGELDAAADEFIGYAVEGATRMQGLLRALLEFSELTTGQRPLDLVDMDGIVAQAQSNLADLIRETGGRISHDPLPRVRGDGAQLLQLIQNLLHNSLKFHGEQPPEIRVRGHWLATESVWHFSVQDNGIGIPAAHANRVFLIFQRLHARERYPGLGIGLAICKKIVGVHGGVIWLESEPGQGAVFHFTLADPGIREARRNG